MKPTDEIEIWSRWESRDWREQGRVLEVLRIAYRDADNPLVFLKTVEAPYVGARRKTSMSLQTLKRRFRPVPTPQSEED